LPPNARFTDFGLPPADWFAGGAVPSTVFWQPLHTEVGSLIGVRSSSVKHP